MARVKSDTDIATSWVSGCRKMPRLWRKPMLRLSISDAPIRMGSVGRRICSRAMGFVLPFGSRVETRNLPSHRACVHRPVYLSYGKCRCQASKYTGLCNDAATRKTDHEGADPRDRRPIVLSAGHSCRGCRYHRRFTHAPASDKPPVQQILGTFDRLERGFAARGFRGCPFVNAVAELGAEDRSVKKIAIAFKESRRLWFRDLLVQLGVADPEGLATQLTLLVDGSIAQDLVRDDPSMARAAKDAARVLLKNAGIKV